MKKKEITGNHEEIKRNTPPNGFPVECCDAANHMWKTLYGDELNLAPGLVVTVKELKETANTIKVQADLILKSAKYFGLNTAKGLLALIGWVISAIFIAKNFLLK